MSYCRWSDDSDVYIYEVVAGGVECCACWLLNPQPGTAPAIDRPSARIMTRSALIAHLLEHRAAGHKVPAGLIDGIREDLATSGDPISN
jgi:hypothetical protein